MVVRASGERGVVGVDSQGFNGVVLSLTDVFEWTYLVDHEVLFFFNDMMFVLHLYIGYMYVA